MDARSVCAKFGIPHYSIDLTEAFEDTVIKYFIGSTVGTSRTRVICNIEIMGGTGRRRRRSVATRSRPDIRATSRRFRITLRRGVDESRDQTYFLWGVPSSYFAHTIFPLGPLVKPQVRALATDYGLTNAEKPESRDICFVADDDLPRFLAERAERDGLSNTPGPSLSTVTLSAHIRDSNRSQSGSVVGWVWRWGNVSTATLIRNRHRLSGDDTDL
jgi:tRNA-specific 2-thiouridylase